jgi:hypothetical protein
MYPAAALRYVAPINWPKIRYAAGGFLRMAESSGRQSGFQHFKGRDALPQGFIGSRTERSLCVFVAVSAEAAPVLL